MKFPLFCITLLLFLSCKENDERNELPILGDLEPGKYEVGFKTLFEFDETRNPLQDSDFDGRLYASGASSPGRQYQINIWYPASAGTGEELSFKHYVDLLAYQTSFDRSDSMDVQGQQRFIQRTNDLGANGKFKSTTLDTLTKMNVLAKLNASPLEDRFPVVVYPNISSPALQSITAEYLSSHGYIVVGFVPKGRFSSGLEVSSEGLEMAVDDIEFVLNALSKWPNADMDKVALMANAITSSICALASSKNDKIRALVSLEGGFISAFEQSLLRRSLSYRPENFTLPMLFIYSNHPSIDPKYVDHLNHATRYFARFPKMSEFAMLNYGMFDHFIPDIIGKHEGGTRTGYEAANLLMLRFFNSNLKEAEIDLFERAFLKELQNDIDSTFILNAVPAAPNIAELKNAFHESGFDRIENIYNELKNQGNEHPFTHATVAALTDWLAWKKDPDYTFRKRLYRLAIDSYPSSSRAHFNLAYYLELTADTLTSIQHYHKAMDLLETDPDATLTRREIRLIKKYSIESLDYLSK